MKKREKERKRDGDSSKPHQRKKPDDNIHARIFVSTYFKYRIESRHKNAFINACRWIMPTALTISVRLLLRKHRYRRDSWSRVSETNGCRSRGIASASAKPPDGNREGITYEHEYQSRRRLLSAARLQWRSASEYAIVRVARSTVRHIALHVPPQDSGGSRLSLAVKQPWISFIYRHFTDRGSGISAAYSFSGIFDWEQIADWILSSAVEPETLPLVDVPSHIERKIYLWTQT